MVERRNTRYTGLLVNSCKSSKYAASNIEIIADLEKLSIPKPQLMKSRGIYKNEAFTDDYDQEIDSLKKMPLKRNRKITVKTPPCDDEIIEALANLIFTKESGKKQVKIIQKVCEKKTCDIQLQFKENIDTQTNPQLLKENCCKIIDWVSRFPNTNANTHVKISWITQRLNAHRKLL